MAERTKQQQDDAEKAGKKAVAETDSPDEAEAFPRERLVAEAVDFFGVPSHIVAGALHGVSKKNVTLEEAEAAIKAWRKAPVKEA